jgi:hypothetical protein
MKAKHNSPAAGGGEKAKAGACAGVLSMARRAMMDAQREGAIKRYREMKERKTKEADRSLLTVEAVEGQDSKYIYITGATDLFFSWLRSVDYMRIHITVPMLLDLSSFARMWT